MELILQQEGLSAEKLDADSLAPNSPHPRLPVILISFDVIAEEVDDLESRNSTRLTEEGGRIETPLSDITLIGEHLVVPPYGPLYPTDWVKTQLGRTIGVKWDRFFGPMTASGKEVALRDHLQGRGKDELVCAVVRNWKQGAPDDSTGILRGFVSPAYAELPDSYLLKLIWDTTGKYINEWAFLRSRFTDRATYWTMVLREPFSLFGDGTDMAFAGIRITNSDVGFSAWTIRLFTFRTMCGNGNIYGARIQAVKKKIHMGNISKSAPALIGEILSQAYELQTTVPEVNRKLRDMRLRAPLSELEIFLHRHGVKAGVGKRGREVAAEYLRQHMEGNSYLSAWDVLQAIISLSPRLDGRSDKQAAVEALGGQYIEQVLDEGPFSNR